ncbi:LacI family transcriptional regulator [Caloranaerobacter sp. TR13]|uniref:LacI family DNA-binding transcriptional regulator n=1 Tax=Caloranaerobacter sp. TR13 TaxID=1302151 RepID=UPI0006D42EF3|nr:LacI family DNA-binding transcriptional regulator [Caloranaerobacter sp. TR13]KPU26922.1 LacI family transcriptional regulator [Caloranaerobacter sp. TR13]
MKITIKDVAKKANVSVATVSRILNNLGGYSEETKEKVLKVIDEIGYQRNEIARGLITKSTNTIGVLVPNVSTNFYAEILNGIEDTAHKNGYSVVVCNTGIGGKRTLAYLDVLSSRQVDGIVITSLTPKEEYEKAIISTRIPSILVSTMSFRYQLPFIRVDDKLAAYSATKYLIEKGHRKIAMIAGNEDDPIAGIPRVEGYMQALRDYNVAIDKELIRHGDFSYESGIKCMRGLLEDKKDFTAVFAASDDMAIGALYVAYKNGISIPDELSVVGYDNTMTARMSIPPLTTLAQPLYEMGKRAVSSLLKKISKGESIESIIMPHKIIERDTVKSI